MRPNGRAIVKLTLVEPRSTLVKPMNSNVYFRFFGKPTFGDQVTCHITIMASYSDVFLPGQIVPLLNNGLKIGSGLYTKDNNVRASIMGTPRFSGSVRILFV